MDKKPQVPPAPLLKFVDDVTQPVVQHQFNIVSETFQKQRNSYLYTMIVKPTDAAGKVLEVVSIFTISVIIDEKASRLGNLILKSIMFQNKKYSSVSEMRSAVDAECKKLISTEIKN